MTQAYDLGEMIQKHRKEFSWTQKYLAIRLGVSESAISRYESGEVIPSFDVLRSMAAVFNVSLDSLCGMRCYGKLSMHGLTVKQQEITQSLVDCFRIRNQYIDRDPTDDERDLLARIAVEFTK